MSVEQIYEQFAAAGTPLTLSAPWQALQVDRNFFRIDDSLETLRDDLLKKFEPRLLIESGLFTTSPGGAAVVNPLAFSPQTVFWALRPAADAPPFQLIADQRSLRRSESSLRSIFRAHETEAWLEETADRVAVAFTMIDLAIHRTLKIPAVPAVGLNRLRGQRLDDFSRLICCDEAAQDERSTVPAAGNRSLLLHDWSLARLARYETSPGAELWSYLKKLRDFLKWELGDCEYIRPTAEELAKLRFIVAHGRWDELRDSLVFGGFVEARSLFDESVQPQEPPSLAAALERWNGGLRRNLDPAAKRAVWQELQAAQEREVLRPLAAAAQATTDPTERNLLTALEGVSRLLHPQTLLLAEKFAQATVATGTGPLAAGTKEEFQQLFATADRVLALSQGVQACRRHQRFPKSNRPERRPPNRFSNGSASDPPTSQP